MSDLIRLAKLAELRDAAQDAVDGEVDRLVRAGVNYGEMAVILGVSRQGVRQAHLRWREGRTRRATRSIPVPHVTVT